MSRQCPLDEIPLAPDGACPACGGAWLSGAAVEARAPGKLSALRRLAGKGPLTHDTCADCRGALKALDVPGPQYEGDLFWGHESPRPAGSSVAHACPRCGGCWAPGAELARAGGRAAFEANLRSVAMGAS